MKPPLRPALLLALIAAASAVLASRPRRPGEDELCLLVVVAAGAAAYMARRRFAFAAVGFAAALLASGLAPPAPAPVEAILRAWAGGRHPTPRAAGPRDFLHVLESQDHDRRVAEEVALGRYAFAVAVAFGACLAADAASRRRGAGPRAPAPGGSTGRPPGRLGGR